VETGDETRLDRNRVKKEGGKRESKGFKDVF
jgi:hypothetical protein